MNETLVTKATKIAKKVHEHQVDKKNYPYMSHVLDIASRVSHLGESYEIVGLLHDAIEDSGSDDFLNEILEEMNTYFDEEVLDAIHAMTKIPGEDYFHEYLPRLKKIKLLFKLR